MVDALHTHWPMARRIENVHATAATTRNNATEVSAEERRCVMRRCEQWLMQLQRATRHGGMRDATNAACTMRRAGRCKATTHTLAQHMLIRLPLAERPHHRPQGRHWLKGHHRPQGRHMGGRASCILEGSAYLQVIADKVYPGAGCMDARPRARRRLPRRRRERWRDPPTATHDRGRLRGDPRTMHPVRR